jgi:hypothetical protein
VSDESLIDGLLQLCADAQTRDRAIETIDSWAREDRNGRVAATKARLLREAAIADAAMPGSFLFVAGSAGWGTGDSVQGLDGSQRSCCRCDWRRCDRRAADRKGPDHVALSPIRKPVAPILKEERLPRSRAGRARFTTEIFTRAAEERTERYVTGSSARAGVAARTWLGGG